MPTSVFTWRSQAALDFCYRFLGLCRPSAFFHKCLHLWNVTEYFRVRPGGGLDHRSAFKGLFFPPPAPLCDVYYRHPYFSLCSVVLVILWAVNHCLHHGRPEDMQRIASFLSCCSVQPQSLSNLLSLLSDGFPLKLLFKKMCFLSFFKGSSKSFWRCGFAEVRLIPFASKVLWALCIVR